MDTESNKSQESQQEGQPRDVLAELEEALRERDQFKSALQRVQADFINYRKRADEERDEQTLQANGRLLKKFLPVLDDLSLALDKAPKKEAPEPWQEGFSLIYRKLQGLLESEGVTRMDAQSKPFDPFEHEALAQQESPDHEDGNVLMVVRDGYKLRGKVLRPAQVIVAQSRTPNTETSRENQVSSENKEK
ncbi:MAG: nucleotide exchange factor GrpE [SAR202 cluster bacterium]|nr:nucleotide exchange factor GrpE [SAR202 cluster bacterium]